MPTNKEALIRYRVINRCLIESKYVSRARLIQACEDALYIAPISERTINQDIHDMRIDERLGYFAPIAFDNNRSAYYYDDDEYSIDNIPINNEELSALSFASSLLQQFKEVDILQTFSSAVNKISDAIHIKRLQQKTDVGSFVQFETVPFFKGSEHLKTLIEAIADKDVLNISHIRFDADKCRIHIVHPYYLKEYRNRWYLIGLDDRINEIRTYGLDRIEEISLNLNIKYKDKPDNAEHFFSNTLGISEPQSKPEEIILKFYQNTGKYLLTQPIHDSQKLIKQEKDEITISLYLVINNELITYILGWGRWVKVIAPESLITRINEELKFTLGRYK
ncbi:MAG: WYL domain-containing protein [Bacteroidetes bacterium]|nr:WYL domain-containing protein [Bacteroidota bacterium]